jgi:hypothetical protein
MMGVAGGELLIPTIVLLYGVDIKVAGSLWLAVSLPTMFGRVRPVQPRRELYSSGRKSLVLAGDGRRLGHRTLLGGLLLGVVPSLVLVPLLVALLLISAVKVWRHQ